MAFGFFGDTEIVKVNTEKKYFCKIHGWYFKSIGVYCAIRSYENNKPQTLQETLLLQCLI
jgi:hypothetical protein